MVRSCWTIKPGCLASTAAVCGKILSGCYRCGEIPDGAGGDWNTCLFASEKNSCQGPNGAGAEKMTASYRTLSYSKRVLPRNKRASKAMETPHKRETKSTAQTSLVAHKVKGCWAYELGCLSSTAVVCGEFLSGCCCLSTSKEKTLQGTNSSWRYRDGSEV